MLYEDYLNYYKAIDLEEKVEKLYIASACFDFMGKSDNCEELTLLIKLRDEYLARYSEGRKLIDLYYYLAPQILDEINASKDKNKYYEFVYKEIKKCVDFIKCGENEKATAHYIFIVLKLSSELF